jgi:hypothetical protein
MADPSVVELSSGKTARLQPDGTYKTDDGVTMSSAQVKSLAKDDGGEAPKGTYREGPDGRLYFIVGDQAKPVSGVGSPEQQEKYTTGAGGRLQYKDCIPYVYDYEFDAMGEQTGGTALRRASPEEVQRALNPPREPDRVSATASAQLAQSAYQFEVTQQRLAEQMAAQIEQKNREIANQEQVIAFQQKQGTFQMEQGLRKEAAETEQRLFTNRLTLQQMQAQRDQINTQMQLQAAQFNAQQQAQYQRDAAEFDIRRTGEMRQANESIGRLAADPADRGAYAGTVLANRGFGQAAGALGQSDLRTEESLQPLQGQLGVRDMLASMKGPQAPTPITAPQLAGIDLAMMHPGGNINRAIGTDQTIPGATNVIGQGMVQTGATPQMRNDANNRMDAAEVPSWVPRFMKGGVDGGNVRIVGERGPELEIDQPDGSTVILNGKQAAKMGIDLKKMMSAGTPNYQTGGIFQNSILPTQQARAFSDETYRQALRGTPWEGGEVPSATYAATPGFDPIVLDLLASISAAGGKGPASSYKRNAALATPMGMGERVVGRSA